MENDLCIIIHNWCCHLWHQPITHIQYVLVLDYKIPLHDRTALVKIMFLTAVSVIIAHLRCHSSTWPISSPSVLHVCTTFLSPLFKPSRGVTALFRCVRLISHGTGPHGFHVIVRIARLCMISTCALNHIWPVCRFLGVPPGRGSCPLTGPLPFDLIYTDYHGLQQMKQHMGLSLKKHKSVVNTYFLFFGSLFRHCVCRCYQ